MDLRVDCPSTFPPGCKIVWCGEAPGEDEVRLREGFTGAAGKILDKIMYVGGIERRKCGFTNVVKRAPDGGFDSEHFKTSFYTTTKEGRSKQVRPSEELQQWYELLKSELTQVAPNVAVACGAEALKALCGLDGITKYRGSILPSTLVPGLKVVPLMHPSWIQRKLQYQEIYIAGRIARDKIDPNSHYPELKYVGWNDLLMPSIQQFEDFVNETIKTGKPYVIDIETREPGYIACVGFATNFEPDDDPVCDYAICVPIQCTNGNYFKESDELRFWLALQRLVTENPNLVTQNGFFDLAWLLEYGITPSGCHDIMLLFHRMYPELPKKLAFTNMLYTDIPYYKDDGKSHAKFVPDDKLWKYNIKDDVAELRIWRALIAEEGKAQEQKLYFEHVQQIMPIAFEMQTLGMDVEKQGVVQARKALLREYGKVRRLLYKLTGLTNLPGNKTISNPQIHKYLYGTLGLPPKTKRGSMSLTADEDAIVELLISPHKACQTEQAQQVLKCVLAEGKFFKALTSYVDWEIFYE